MGGDEAAAEQRRNANVDAAGEEGSGETAAAGQEQPAAGAGDELAGLRGELQRASARAEELAGRWQRTQADFINYKRRVEQERSELAKVANLGLVARILPVVDDFERAMATLPRELYRLTWIEGVALIQRKLEYMLEQEGLTPIEALGKDFDPALHEVVTVEEGVAPHEGQVVAELQRGYRLHDRVLRPALVKVGRRPVETGKE